MPRKAATAPKFEMGDKVTWNSQAGSHAIQKTGTVVAVIPAKTYYTNFERDLCNKHKCSSVYGGGFSRGHESYAILVPQEGKDGTRYKPKLYWPRVSALQKAD